MKIWIVKLIQLIFRINKLKRTIQTTMSKIKIKIKMQKPKVKTKWLNNKSLSRLLKQLPKRKSNRMSKRPPPPPYLLSSPLPSQLPSRMTQLFNQLETRPLNLQIRAQRQLTQSIIQLIQIKNSNQSMQLKESLITLENNLSRLKLTLICYSPYWLERNHIKKITWFSMTNPPFHNKSQTQP